MKKLLKVEENFIGLLILAMTVFALVQVISRYLLKTSIPWIEELTRYLMIWMVFVAGAVAISKRSHLKVEILEILLPANIYHYVDMAIHGIMTLFTGYFALIALRFVRDQVSIGQVSPAMQVSMAWPLAALFVGGALMTIQGAYLVYQLAASKNNAPQKNEVSK